MRQITKRASPGERVIGSLFPAQYATYPNWSGDRYKQVQHLKNWVMVAIDTIACKVASIFPNIAYVVDSPRRGRTVKACQRGLMNARGIGFSPSDGWISAEQGGHSLASLYPSIGFSDGGHSFLTVGEYRSKALSVVKPHEDLEPLESEHQLRRLLENPNPVDTFFDFSYEWDMFEELCGVGYVWVVPNRWGMPCEMWVIPSHWVWPRTGGKQYVTPDHPNADRLIQYYEIRPWGMAGSGESIYLPADEVIMTRWKSPINKIDGYSKLSAIAQWADLEESISTSRWAQMINQARPELLVELGSNFEDPDADQLRRIEAKFLDRIQGEFNYGKPLIGPPGAKITPLSFSPTEMAYFESENQIRDMILSAWRVPKSAVGVTDQMTYGSILATLMQICEWCINPRLRMRGQAITKHLASRWDEPGRRVRVWYDDTSPADPQQVNDDIRTDAGVYAITPNMVLAIRGRKAYSFGGDDPIGQSGVTPIPLNSGKSTKALSALMAPMSAGGAAPAQGGQGAALHSRSDKSPTDDDSAEGGAANADTAADGTAPRIDKPNGKPSKKRIEQPEGRLMHGGIPRSRGAALWKSRNASKPHGDDDLPETPDPIDADLWRQCQALTPSRPGPLPQQLGVVDGYNVMLVDGDQVKVEHEIDFIEGGNPFRYPAFIPEGEFWLDSNAAAHNRPFILYHEAWESRLMSTGMSYDEAHKRANGVEWVLRSARSRPPSALKSARAVRPASRLVRKGPPEESFFSRCDRDDKGHCKPENGGGDKPAEEAPEKPSQPPSETPSTTGTGDSAESKKPAHEFFDKAQLSAPAEVDQPIPHDIDYEPLKPKAEKANEELKTTLKGIASKLGYRTVPAEASDEERARALSEPGGVVLLAHIKSKERATQKVAKDYHGDWRKLLDVARASVGVDKLSQVRPVVQEMLKGLELARTPKDRINHPAKYGYRDLLMNVRTPSGMVAEVQVHLKPVLEAKELAHPSYETVQRIERRVNAEGRPMTPDEKKDYKEAEEKMTKLYDDAWRKVQD
jgi:phage portal protein BeeE